MTGSIEIDVVFPDRFYRAETSMGGLAMTRIDGFERLQRLIQRDHVFIGPDCDFLRVGQRDANARARTLRGAAVARVVDQRAPHLRGHQGDQMITVVDRDAGG